MFQIGDKAVYPGHGVGVIEAIETKQISGKELMFYILRVLDNGMTIMIPRDNAGAVGLRGVIRKLEIPKGPPDPERSGCRNRQSDMESPVPRIHGKDQYRLHL